MATRIKEGMTGAEVAQIIDEGFDNLDEIRQNVESNTSQIEAITHNPFVFELMGIGTTKEEVNINYRGKSQGSSFEEEFQRTIPSASSLNAGVMTAADKTKLDLVVTDGDGMQFLSDDGTYKTIADEEDITAEDGKLKLKDRAYDEANFSGKGYKILRKNIVEGKNILTQEMINKPNTIYEIRYDFDLNEQTIKIQDNTIFIFNGGSLNNGKISKLTSNIHFINTNLKNISYSGEYPRKENIKYYIDESDVIKDKNNIMLGDIIYLIKRQSDKDNGGGYYKADYKGNYATQGGIELDTLTLAPIKYSTRGIFNMNNYGILPNGEDMSDKLNNLLQSDLQWVFNEATLYFPSGSYIFKKPINFSRRFVILGDENGFRNETYTGTEFNFSGIKNNTENELYCITSSSIIKKIKNISFKCDSYDLVENRNSILTGNGENVWTETINQNNICCITNVQHIEDCLFTGFSGKCIKSGFVFCNKLHFTKCNICIQSDNDSVLTDIYALYVNNITYRSGELTIINNVRGDSIKDIAFNIIGNTTTFSNICIDWGYKSIFSLRGDDSFTSTTVRQITIKTNALRNVINYNIIDKNFHIGKTLYITDENTSPYIGIVTLPSGVTINELATNIEIVGSYFNAKDAGPDDITNIIPNVGITINCSSNIKITGNISITMTDIKVEDILKDYKLFRRFVEIVDNVSTLSGNIIINGEKFILNNLSRNNYNSSTIIYNDNLSIKTMGIFNDRPNNIKRGFAYFCTDKQTSEGTRNGIMIYYVGDNTWVDALGRIVS